MVLWTYAPKADDLFDALDHSGEAYVGTQAFLDLLIDAVVTAAQDEKP